MRDKGQGTRDNEQGLKDKGRDKGKVRFKIWFRVWVSR